MKITVRIRADQHEYIKKMMPGVPYNMALRGILDKYIELHKKKTAKRLEEAGEELELGE